MPKHKSSESDSSWSPKIARLKSSPEERGRRRSPRKLRSCSQRSSPLQPDILNSGSPGAVSNQSSHLQTPQDVHNIALIANYSTPGSNILPSSTLQSSTLPSSSLSFPSIQPSSIDLSSIQPPSINSSSIQASYLQPSSHNSSQQEPPQPLEMPKPKPPGSQQPQPGKAPQKAPPKTTRPQRYSVFDDPACRSDYDTSKSSKREECQLPDDAVIPRTFGPNKLSFADRQKEIAAMYPYVEYTEEQNKSHAETMARWKANPYRVPDNYIPPEDRSWADPKPKPKSPVQPSAQNLRTATRRCLVQSYESDKKMMSNMARGQRRLKEEYREFEEEIDDAIEVQGINDKQHKRLRRIRTKLDSMLRDLEIELKELELKKRDDHERLLELLGPDSGK